MLAARFEAQFACRQQNPTLGQPERTRARWSRCRRCLRIALPPPWLKQRVEEGLFDGMTSGDRRARQPQNHPHSGSENEYAKAPKERPANSQQYVAVSPLSGTKRYCRLNRWQPAMMLDKYVPFRHRVSLAHPDRRRLAACRWTSQKHHRSPRRAGRRRHGLSNAARDIHAGASRLTVGWRRLCPQHYVDNRRPRRLNRPSDPMRARRRAEKSRCRAGWHCKGRRKSRTATRARQSLLSGHS